MHPSSGWMGQRSGVSHTAKFAHKKINPSNVVCPTPPTTARQLLAECCVRQLSSKLPHAQELLPHGVGASSSGRGALQRTNACAQGSAANLHHETEIRSQQQGGLVSRSLQGCFYLVLNRQHCTALCMLVMVTIILSEYPPPSPPFHFWSAKRLKTR